MFSWDMSFFVGNSIHSTDLYHNLEYTICSYKWMLTHIDQGRNDHEIFVISSLSHQVRFHHMFALRKWQIQPLVLGVEISEGWNQNYPHVFSSILSFNHLNVSARIYIFFAYESSFTYIYNLLISSYKLVNMCQVSIIFFSWQSKKHASNLLTF